MNAKFATKTTPAPGGFNTLREALIQVRVVKPPLGAAVVRTADGRFGPAFSRKDKKEKVALPSK